MYFILFFYHATNKPEVNVNLKITLNEYV
jgi:hypothetical protein